MKTFTAKPVPMTDGGMLHEVVTQEGERIASCTDGYAMQALADMLNGALDRWVAENPTDRVLA